MIETKQDVIRLEQGLKNIQSQRNRFIIQTVTDLVDSIIVDEIHRRMRQENYDEKIIAATRLDKVTVLADKVKFRIVSEYVTDTGFDVALARERTGTTAHKVEADPERKTESGRPPALKIQIGFGPPLFRKSAFVSGIEAKHIIERTLEELTPEVADEYRRRERTWIKSNLS